MPPSAAGFSLTQSVALVWRTLRSMRTALILLLLLALAAVTGSLIPQWPNSPERVLQYQAGHGLWGTFLQRAGAFDVFGSWWFVLITVLLFVSLVACLVPRTRATWRAVRQRPIQAREIDAFRHYRTIAVAAGPGEAVEASRRVLVRRLYRVASAEGQGDTAALAAEKGAAREVGSLLFHWAFILLLFGVIFGKGTGFSGYAVITEGQTWVDARANYDGQIRTGRFFGGDFTGVGIHLRSFESDFRDTGQPMDFVSRVDLLDPQGNLIRSQDIRVNHPAKIDGLNIYQTAFGWAGVLEVRDGDQVLSRQALVLSREPAPDGVPAFAMPWYGVLKVSSARPQMAIEVELYPDSRALAQQLQTQQPVPMLVAYDPVISYKVWRGRLTDPSPTSLDTTFMKKTAEGVVGGGFTADLHTGKQLEPGRAVGGLTMSFPDLRHYSVLQVTRDRGVPIVLAAAILILLGLLPALYTSRRKVWVRAEAHGEGSVVQVGGFALQRKPQFEAEFGKLVEAIERAIDDGGSATRVTDGSDREKVGSR